MKKYIRILPFTGLAASIALGGALSAQTSSDRTNVRDQQRQSQTADRNVDNTRNDTRTDQTRTGQARQDQDRAGQAGQDWDRSDQDRSDYNRSDRTDSRPMKASDLRGMNINSGSDEKIGEIDEIYIDTNSGKVLAMVVSTGGFLGMGQDKTLISPEDLHFNDDRSVLKADLTKDQIRSAPRYNADDRTGFDRVRPLGNTGADWDSRQERSDRMQTRTGPGQAVSDRGTSGNNQADRMGRMNQADHTGQMGQADRTGRMNQADHTGQMGQTDRTGQMGQADRTGRTEQADRRDTRSAAGTTGQTAAQRRTTGDDYSNLTDRTNERMDAQSEGRHLAVSDLVGMSVENRQGESIGDIDEVFVDLENREVAGVVVSTGGFLGMGDRKTLFGMKELSFDHNNEKVLVNYNRDQIRTFAQYRENDQSVFEALRERTDRLDPRAAASARSSRYDDQSSTDRARDDQSRYGQSSDGTRTDDSRTDGVRTEARNVGSAALGRSSDMTVFSQGNSSEEIAMTASIRTALREDRALSSRANNVTIITKDNRVLLRGEVDSESEKSAVEAVAHNKAGRQNVTSELTVRGR